MPMLLAFAGIGIPGAAGRLMVAASTADRQHMNVPGSARLEPR